MFLEKLQKQPEGVKKIIIWSAVAVVGIGLFFIYFKNFKKNLEKFNMPVLPKIGLPKMPEIPEIPEEFKTEIKKLGEELKNATGTKTE